MLKAQETQSRLVAWVDTQYMVPANVLSKGMKEEVWINGFCYGQMFDSKDILITVIPYTNT